MDIFKKAFDFQDVKLAKAGGFYPWLFRSSPKVLKWSIKTDAFVWLK